MNVDYVVRVWCKLQEQKSIWHDVIHLPNHGQINLVSVDFGGYVCTNAAHRSSNRVIRSCGFSEWEFSLCNVLTILVSLTHLLMRAWYICPGGVRCLWDICLGLGCNISLQIGFWLSPFTRVYLVLVMSRLLLISFADGPKLNNCSEATCRSSPVWHQVDTVTQYSSRRDLFLFWAG